MAKWTIRSLTPKYKQILRLYAAGKKQVEIARIMGMTPVAIGAIIRSPLFQAALQELEKEVDSRFKEQLASLPLSERLQKLADKAIEVLAEHIENPATPSLQLSAAKDILDRAGFRAPKEFVVHTVKLDGQFQDDIRKALSDLEELEECENEESSADSTSQAES